MRRITPSANPPYVLARFRERLVSLDAAPTISYPKLDEYDERFVLKSKL